MPAYDFPQDLLDAQAALTQAQAERDTLARTLPWSAEPMPGWEAPKHLHSDYQPTKDDSPGYTPDQAAQVAAHRARILELTTLIVTHSYWATLDGPTRIDARSALKHAHEPAAGA